MTPLALFTTLALTVSTGAQAQSWRDRLNQGADLLRQGADAVQDGAKVIGDRTNESINSTVDLFTNEATPEETRAELDIMAARTLERLFQEQPDAMVLFSESYGHAVFDTRKVVLAGIAAGAGRGVAVSGEDAGRIYMGMGTAGVGWSFGLGGFETQVVILFREEWLFNEFVTYGYDASADAGTMFGDDTASLGVHWIDGRAMFFLTEQGWKASATAAGTKYWVDPALN